MSEKKRKFETGLLVEGYIECFVETEEELKDARHALDEAHRILYETERRYKNALRAMIDVRGGLADARAKAGHAEIAAKEFEAMQAWVEEGKTDHAPGSIGSLLN